VFVELGFGARTKVDGAGEYAPAEETYAPPALTDPSNPINSASYSAFYSELTEDR
jgi:hypothetical protein